MKAKGKIVAVICLLLVVVSAVLLYRFLPRRVETTFSAYLIARGEVAEEPVSVSLDGDWTPELFSGFKASFRGTIRAEGVPLVEEERGWMMPIAFQEIDEIDGIGYFGHAYLDAPGNGDIRPSGTIEIYYQGEEKPFVIVIYTRDREEQFVLIANCTSKEDAAAHWNSIDAF